MRRMAIICAVGVVAAMTLLRHSSALDQGNSVRKIVTRVAPRYPELAKRMHVRGTVRLEAVVRPNGTVKSTRVLGGNPILVQPAIEAVQQWKFAVSQNETVEIVQLNFSDE